MSRPWFGVKRYGIGLSPTSGQGWAALLAYVVTLAATPLLAVRLGAPSWIVPLALAAETAALIAVVLLKGDGKPWRWRWGQRR
ncbi:hypothetical protein [Phenylobacterium deserti]|uniref:Uncharacterized protein n=1 Tax=Phenylobacterium deserti TaxID=1914756 RepID=A0A328AA25_9CAUL|nr:hypothetical protein [Phenylobacterium deserti]RAK51441.1 hypothetical protein DJ018_16015 [Phenylobacterium deserti]